MIWRKLTFFLMTLFVFKTAFAVTSREDAIKFFQRQAQLEEFKCTFAQKKFIKSIHTYIESKGKLEVKADQISWKVVSPSYLETIIEENQITMKSKGPDGEEKKEQYKRKDLGEKAFLHIQDLFYVFNMEWGQLEKKYKVTMENEKSQKMSLTPLTSHYSISSIVLELGHDRLLKSVRLNELSGDFIDIHFSDYQIIKEN